MSDRGCRTDKSTFGPCNAYKTSILQYFLLVRKVANQCTTKVALDRKEMCKVSLTCQARMIRLGWEKRLEQRSTKPLRPLPFIGPLISCLAKHLQDQINPIGLLLCKNCRFQTGDNSSEDPLLAARSPASTQPKYRNGPSREKKSRQGKARPKFERVK